MGFLNGLFAGNKLPDFLIIGAQKAGTTSLANYLAQHPSVVAPKWKEVHFFDLNYEKGPAWYRSNFPISRRERLERRLQNQQLLSGDATPYYILHPCAARRAFDLIPKARIIVMLRDPVDRAYSHYHHEIRLGKESLPFEEAIAAEPSRIAGEVEQLEADPLYKSLNYQHFTYLARGVYCDQIRQWLRYYRRDRVLIVSSERFFESPALEYRRVLKFLGLMPWELSAYPAEHVGKYQPISYATRDRLIKYYSPHNQILRQYLNSTWPGVGDTVVDRFSAA